MCMQKRKDVTKIPAASGIWHYYLYHYAKPSLACGLRQTLYISLYLAEGQCKEDLLLELEGGEQLVDM
jgi:hypothetical protein